MITHFFLFTHFEPRLRHFRCPGINLLAPDSRIEPDGVAVADAVAAAAAAIATAVDDDGDADDEADVAVLAGDKFNEASVDGSIW